jgi:hypothetical protein
MGQNNATMAIPPMVMAATIPVRIHHEKMVFVALKMVP